MSHLFATSGMTAMTILIAAIEIFSLMVMGAFLYEYRHIRGFPMLHSS